MKVSLNWVKEFTEVGLPVDELVAKIGAQLGAVEEVVNLGERYQGIVIVKVVECKPLEGSDHLSVCRVDDAKHVKDVERGEDGLVQVVCGAPNVHEGMLVAWLPPGATVPSSWDGEHFVLEARQLRGVISNGMLASAKELGIGDSHEGLLELDEGQAGDDFAKTYKLDDYIIDIENKMFTHRPDLFGVLGVAREIAGITGRQFSSPAVYKDPQPAPAGTSELLEVRNEIPRLVPRFVAQVFQGAAVKPSPVWLQTYLARVGIRPINNIVDLTNYFMVLTGQPLHAYDYDKVKALSGGDKAVIVVRNPHSGEKLQLLNGKEIEPRPEAIMIATDKQAIGLGGVMGGGATEVDAATQNIVLECATFDMYSIRRTSMAQGLFTDAVTRFTKGQSPLQNDRIAAWVREQLVSLTGATAGDLLDDNHVEPGDLERGNLYPPVTITAAYINERLGLQLPAQEMKQLLENTEFSVEADGDTLTVHAPFWRTDIELREDVVEEVGRLYGFDHLPLTLPKRDLTPAVRDPLLEAKTKIRAVLSKAGANEVLTYSFVHGNLLVKAGQDPGQAYRLGNALSPDLQYYRLSLMPSLLASVHPNIKAGYDEFALFELGKVHTRERQEAGKLPAEDEYTTLVVAASDKLRKQGSAYYQARTYLAELAGVPLTFKPLAADMQSFAVMQPYQPGRAALVSLQDSDTFLGIIGEFKPAVVRQLKLPKYCAGFELDTTVLQQVLGQADAYVPLPRYPQVTQDVSLQVPAELEYQELLAFVQTELSKVQPENSLKSLAPVDIYQGEDKSTKNITLRLTIANYERTMTDREVNELLEKAAAAAAAKFGAKRL